MNELLKTFLRPGSHYSAILPYNLAWKLKPRMIHNLANFLNSNPINVFDIGARGADLGEISNLKKYLRYIAFDADQLEAKALETRLKGEFHDLRVYPYFIGSKGKSTQFNIYYEPGQSSVYNPAPRYRGLFGGEKFGIAKKINIREVTLDNLAKAEKLQPPDLLKIDTQGSELSILKAAPKIIDQTLLLEVECELIEMYEGQPLMHHVCDELYRHGFEILYINRVFANRSSYDGAARGQIIFCDVLFGRREDKLLHIPIERLAKYAILLANYGHIDFAAELWKNHVGIQELIPGLGRIFKKKSHKLLPRKINRILMEGKHLFSKVLLWVLCLRKYNGINMDSDRSWPIR